MATNLRLRPEVETALRKEAERTGRSQQALIREALESFLGLAPNKPTGRTLDELIAAGIVHPPREPFRRAPRLAPLPEGVTTVDLLDREDRF
ncbi:hypothetical protein GCM10022239_04400 [Leifsonia bigeumensis]|uniref:Ribbon-helix-helix protein CopG domain-containing protein n=1 Tax=Leifsonella bigeumensis TaxID=433643 RepID=A0ABP7F4T3_9MICO